MIDPNAFDDLDEVERDATRYWWKVLACVVGTLGLGAVILWLL